MLQPAWWSMESSFLFDHKKTWLPLVINALEARIVTDKMQFSKS